MKILILSKYGRLGASSRVRMYQYIPYLSTAGIDADVCNLFDDEYLRVLYSKNRRPASNVLKSYLRRLIKLIRGGDYDLFWIEKELFPMLPAAFESLLSIARGGYVVDYDDAVFHNYDRHGSALVRAMLGRKIDSVMKRAAAVAAGNDYLAERARSVGARNIEIIPSSVDTSVYRSLFFPERGRFTIGWVGSPKTLTYLESVKDVIAKFAEGREVRLLLVGAGEGFSVKGVNVESRAWDETAEVALINEMNAGIMPLNDTPWERGKCGYKLVQYMACGRPVVASDVGANCKIVSNGGDGFLVKNDCEWLQALEFLYNNYEKSREMGMLGREKIDAGYSLKVNAPRIENLLRQAVARKGSRAE